MNCQGPGKPSYLMYADRNKGRSYIQALDKKEKLHLGAKKHFRIPDWSCESCHKVYVLKDLPEEKMMVKISYTIWMSAFTSHIKQSYV